MSATPEQWSRVQDPTTSASELQSLAAVEPELWAAIEAHPNVYADLVTWMHDNGLVTTPVQSEPVQSAPVSTVPVSTVPYAQQQPAAPATPATQRLGAVVSWIRPRARLLIGAGAGVVAAIVAVVLVMTLIVAPQQRAAEAAAAALEQAIADFDNSVARCDRVNEQLTSTLAAAQEEVAVDPGTLDDLSTITALQGTLDTVSPTEPCASPEIATDAADIDEQTGTVTEDADRVELATAGLTDAIGKVQDSAAAKARAAAEAEAEAERQQQAALLAARTWTMQDANGYSFTATLEVAAPTTSATYGDYSLGAACSFDATTDIAIPVTMRVTATTQGFDTDISALVTLSRSGSSQPHDVEIEAYYSDGPSCKSPAYGSTILDGVHWDDPFTTGASGSHQLVVIIRDWKTPATPGGDTGFLSVLHLSVSGGQSSGYGTSDRKSVTLANETQ